MSEMFEDVIGQRTEDSGQRAEDSRQRIVDSGQGIKKKTKAKTTGQSGVLIRTKGEKIFAVVNYFIILAACLICVLPIMNILAISFSGQAPVAAGNVTLWPVEFTTQSYRFAIEDGRFFRSFMVSVQRVILGVGINLFCLTTAAYPLSKSKVHFGARNFYMGFFFIVFIFGGGLIPWYILMANLNLFDTIWALVLPLSTPVMSLVILMNFIREIPKEMEEAAMIDGAGHFRVLVQILLPVLKPALATIGLFAFVHHWNSWVDGMLFMKHPANVPLQTYLQTLLVSMRDIMRTSGGDYLRLLQMMSEQTGRAAQLFLGLVPMLMVYPFLQKYFTKGLVMGSVKG